MKKQLLILGFAALFAGSAQAAALPEQEMGLLLGGSWIDSDLSGGKDDATNPTIGIRYAQRLGTATNFFSDLTYASVDGNRAGVGDGAITTLRGGMEWLFSQQPRYNWFLAGGLGAINVNTDNGPDFTRPLLSVGVGQAWGIGANNAFRWEIRADQSFGNDSLPNSSLTNVQALLGYSWGVGAPLDSDGDGVSDRNDKCPGTPKGARVNNTGCPLDSDGDGVHDGLDQCPVTPIGVKVDGRGCPLDSDGDGVSGEKDKCPNTPRGEKVGTDGCPPPTPAPVPSPAQAPEPRKLILEGVNFDNDKAALRPESLGILDNAAATLKEWGDVKVEVAGHTDANNSDAYNLRLSQRRAYAVRNYLVDKGIAAERLTVRGYGESRPIADNATEEGRHKNRRVELVPQK